MDLPSTASGPPVPAGHSLLARLRGLLPSLSPAERRVAEVVLDDPRGSAALTIAALAARAETSQTTVLRLCRRLGLGGYPRLRLALAEEGAAARRAAAETTDIRAEDDVDDVVAKVAALDTLAVDETAEVLDRLSLAEAAAAIAAAGRVDVYGSAASALVAADLQQKLHRIGLVAFAWSDPHLALPGASLLRRGDVAVGVSHSGTTAETVEALRRAAASGALTVAVTNDPGSPVAEAARLVLRTAARETELRSGATASRIAALTVVDCLYLLVAQRRLPAARAAVAGTRDAVAGHHLR